MRCPWTSTTLKCSQSLKFSLVSSDAYPVVPGGGVVARRPRHRYVGSCNFGGNLNQSELVVHVAAAAGLSKADAGKAVEAVFAGTADVDDERCSADLTVSVGGEQQAQETATNCFDS